eukprot:360740-Chlamydomonas_euryale.AAC.8
MAAEGGHDKALEDSGTHRLDELRPCLQRRPPLLLGLGRRQRVQVEAQHAHLTAQLLASLSPARGTRGRTPAHEKAAAAAGLSAAGAAAAPRLPVALGYQQLNQHASQATS